MQTIILTPGEKLKILVTRHAKKTGKDFDTIAAIAGSSRRIGAIRAFLLSAFLTPIVGLIAVLLSKRKETGAQ